MINKLGILCCACFVACFLQGGASAQPPGTEPTTGIRQRPVTTHSLLHAHLIAEPGKVIEDATIVIAGGRIQSVEPGGPAKPGSRVWDLSGKYVYAGLIDAFTTQDIAAVSAGAPHWNPYIQPQRRMADSFQSDETVNGKLRKQGITARLVAPRSGIIKGSASIVLSGKGPRSDTIVVADAAHVVRLNLPFSRERSQYPNSPMGAVALARQVFIDAKWYQSAWQQLAQSPTGPRPKRDDALAALQPLLQNKQFSIFETSNELSVLRAADFAGEFGLQGVLLGSGYEYRRLVEIQQTGMPVIVPVDFPLPPNVSTAEDSLSVTLSSLMHWDLAPENPGRLDKQGIRICFTSNGLSDTGKFLEQIRLAVRRGLDEDQALAALTTNPAEIFAADRLGRVAVGFAANLAVTDGGLFDKKTKVLETWVDGERFEIEKDPLSIEANWVSQWKVNDVERQVTVELTGTTAKPVGKLSWTADGKDQSLKLTKLKVTESLWAFAFRGESLGVPGILRASATRSEKDDAVRWVGVIELPDGARHDVLFAALDKAAEAAGSPPEVSKPDSAKPDSAKPDSAKPDSAKPDSAKPDEDAKAKKENAPSSLTVNYPFGAYGREQAPPAQNVVLLTDATVWTCGPAGVIRRGSVLIRDGRVVAVGRNIATPPGAVVINVAGKHITPGIIDCHSHMATDGGVNESAQANTAEVRIGDFIDSDDIDIYRQLAGGVTSSNILHGSANPIGGQNQVIKLRWGQGPSQLKFAEAPQGIKFALGENVKRSNSNDPEAQSRYPQSRMGVEQFFRDNFVAAQIYQAKFESWNKNPVGLPPRRDLELEAIGEIVTGKRWIHCHSYRQDEILALIRVLDDFKIRIGTFQHILEGYKVAKEMAAHGAMGSSFSDWWAYKFEVFDAIPYNGALMHQAGVVVSFNSDDRELARHLNQEAGKAVKYGGVPAEEALKFVTLNPAKQLRIDQYVGSLEPGKHADLVVWSGPPLSNLSRCEQTWVDGRRFFDLDEDRTLRSRDQTAHRALVQKILASGLPMAKPGETKVDPTTLWPREDEFCHKHDHHDEQHHEH